MGRIRYVVAALEEMHDYHDRVYLDEDVRPIEDFNRLIRRLPDFESGKWNDLLISQEDTVTNDGIPIISNHRLLVL